MQKDDDEFKKSRIMQVGKTEGVNRVNIMCSIENLEQVSYHECPRTIIQQNGKTVQDITNRTKEAYV